MAPLSFGSSVPSPNPGASSFWPRRVSCACQIEHLTDKPATVFGNSSGAIVALEVLTQYPERVQTVGAHEPLVVLLPPDATKWLAFFDGVYDTYREDGVPKAMHQFASGIAGSGDRQVRERSMAKPGSFGSANIFTSRLLS